MGSDVVFGALQQDMGLWPVGGVCTVRHYTRNCAGCRLRRQKRGEQLMAPLPASRLKPRTHVFAYAASDLAGPFSVTVGRSSAKRWICLFICMVSTAIRIEVSVDLTASTFINVFQRFCVLQGFVLNSSVQTMERTLLERAMNCFRAIVCEIVSLYRILFCAVLC